MAAPPEAVFDFVLDLERYRQADRNIGRGRTITRCGDEGTARFSGRLLTNDRVGAQPMAVVVTVVRPLFAAASCSSR